MNEKRFVIIQYLLLICVMILLIGLQRATYSDRNYRQDEINTIHAAKLMSPSEITFWMATNIHPPAWRLLADSWIDAFGLDESIVRWLSVFANMLTFALLFRLGTDLLDWRLGLLAVILLGVYPAAANHMSELRPYPYLIMLTTGLHLFFLRWLQHQKFRYMLGYIIFGMLALYTHYYAIYIFPAHLMFMLITVRWNPSFYIRTLSMWLFIGLSFTGWLIPFVHGFTVRQRGGIYYALPNQVEGLALLYQRLQFIPIQIGQFLVLIGLATPAFFAYPKRPNTAHRWRSFRPVLYSLIITLSIVVIAWSANSLVKNVTDRNMIIIVPSLVLLMALGLRALPSPAYIILSIILMLGASQFYPTITSNAPYREIIDSMADSYQADSVLITDFSVAWQWLLPAAYTLMDFDPIAMPKQNMLHLISPDDRAHSPGPPDRLLNVYSAITAQQLDKFAANHPQLWLLQQGSGSTHQEMLKTWLTEHYAQLRQATWHDILYPTDYTLIEYARLPQDAQLILQADANYELHAWSLQESVDITACQTITLETWWQTQQPSQNPDELVLVLADDNGQVAISEKTPADIFTTDWIADTFYRDQNTLTIPCDIQAGSYNLLLGMKDSITGKSLVLTYPDGNDIGTLYYLTTLNSQEN